jgi:hypothetical protein
MSESKTFEPVVRSRRGQKRRRNGKLKNNTRAAASPLFDVGAGALIRQPRFIIRDQVYRTSQSSETINYLTSSVTVPTFAATGFQFSALDQASSCETVFDQYRIDWIEVTLIPTMSEGNSIANVGILTLVVDHDDDTALTTIGAADDYPFQQTVRGSDLVRVVFKPRVAVAAYSGAFTSFKNEVAGWIDMASPSVKHYGIKTAWSSTSSVLNYNAVTRYALSFRAVR